MRIELSGGAFCEVPKQGFAYHDVRGGSSLGHVFLAKQMPAAPLVRNALLLTFMGAPGKVEGRCGHNQVTKKLAIVGPMAEADEGMRAKATAKGGADFFYSFYQYADGLVLTDKQSCINVFAGLGGIAIMEGWVKAANGLTGMRVYKTNTDSCSSLEVQTDSNGEPIWDGTAAQDGIEYSETAPVIAGFNTPATKVLLPTGEQQNIVNGVPVTLINYDMPAVIINYADIADKVGQYGFTGKETKGELQQNTALWENFINPIRLNAAEFMGIKDTASTPKVIIVMPPNSSDVACRTLTYINQKGEVHEAIGGMMAVDVAAAAYMPNSTIHSVAKVPILGTDEAAINIGHPSGVRQFFVTAGNAETGFDGGRSETTAWYLGDGHFRPNPARLRMIYQELLKAEA